MSSPNAMAGPTRSLRIAANRRNAFKSEWARNCGRETAGGAEYAGDLCSQVRERQLRSRGEVRREFRRLQCDLIAISAPRSVPRRRLLVLQQREEKETNPMHLSDWISIGYKEEARNKPNVVIPNYINMLREFLASF